MHLHRVLSISIFLFFSKIRYWWLMSPGSEEKQTYYSTTFILVREVNHTHSPAFHLCWDLIANASQSSREMLYCWARFSAVMPIGTLACWSIRPCHRESSIWAVHARQTQRLREYNGNIAWRHGWWSQSQHSWHVSWMLGQLSTGVMVQIANYIISALNCLISVILGLFFTIYKKALFQSACVYKLEVLLKMLLLFTNIPKELGFYKSTNHHTILT